MLYKRWYIESFLRALKNCLRPVIKDEDGRATIDDADNVLRHILARSNSPQWLTIDTYEL